MDASFVKASIDAFVVASLLCGRGFHSRPSEVVLEVAVSSSSSSFLSLSLPAVVEEGGGSI